MRHDIAKVICEDARRGSRDNRGVATKYNSFFKYQDRKGEDRDTEYANLDALPKQEGIRSRFRVNYGDTRDFSENLAPIRGLIVKNVGKNWDKIFSQLCDLVKPNGINVHRHVHQHLGDFIEVNTKMVGDAVYVSGRFGRAWEPLAKAIDGYLYRNGKDGFYYYVHPVTRCITRIKTATKKVFVPEKTAICTKDRFLVKMNGLWWDIELAENYTVDKVYRLWDDRTKKVVTSVTKVDKYDSALWDKIRSDEKVESYLRYLYALTSYRTYGTLKAKVLGSLAAIGKKQLSNRDLRAFGVRNDDAKEPAFEMTKSGWKKTA